MTGGTGRMQCLRQLQGLCDGRRENAKCPHYHKNMCIPYRDNGVKGCRNYRECKLLHPFNCDSVREKRVCGVRSCRAWHDKWSEKVVGLPIDPQGGWDGGQFRYPPKGFEKTPGIREKAKVEDKKDTGNAAQPPRKGGLGEKVDQLTEVVEKLAQRQAQEMQQQAQEQAKQQQLAPGAQGSAGGVAGLQGIGNMQDLQDLQTLRAIKSMQNLGYWGNQGNQGDNVWGGTGRW